MIEIRLPNGVWSYDLEKPLGPVGGFGAVFEGVDQEGRPVAVKQLHLDAEQAAHRELTIVRELVGGAHDHVMPVLDAGQDAESDRYYIVMPVAEESLQDALDASGPMSEGAAADVLSQIARGLVEASDFVHRDLKPANIADSG